MKSLQIDWKNLTILVVEDDESLCDILVEVFEAKCKKVLRAGNGAVALSILEAIQVDLVFSDIRMPVMDGVELLKRIKLKNKNEPAVFLTTGHADIDEKEVKKLGAHGLLYKPLNCKDLITKLEVLFSNQCDPNLNPIKN